MAIHFMSVVPILRIFDVAKADEFYQGFLGFKVDWDHRFDDNAPLYRQVSRGDLVLHLSEHHGDGSPGARLRVMMRGVEEFHREISARNYRYMRPGLEKTRWGRWRRARSTRSGTSFAFASASTNANLAADHGATRGFQLPAFPATRPAPSARPCAASDPAPAARSAA
jgi:hypothetical protein